MIVVSDTSPILSLALIERLDLLRDLYGSIVIPEAVRQELMVTDHRGVQEVSQADWIDTRPVEPGAVLKLLQREVDRGEAEAIGLAVQLKADVLLIDERKARKLAQYLELNVVGLLDVLHEAKQRQLIPTIKPVLDDLLTRALSLKPQTLSTHPTYRRRIRPCPPCVHSPNTTSQRPLKKP